MGQIEILALKVLAMQPVGVDQLAQGIFERDMEERFQFADEITCGSCGHQGGGGIQQGAVPRKPRLPAAPQALGVESGDGAERVEGSAVGITALVRQSGEFAEDGDIDLGAQSGLHLGHGEGAEPAEECHQRFERESDGSHTVRITPELIDSSVILTLYESHSPKE